MSFVSRRNLLWECFVSLLTPWKLNYVMLSIEADCGAFVLYLYEEKYVHYRLEVIYPIVLHQYYPLVNALLGFRTEMQT